MAAVAAEPGTAAASSATAGGGPEAEPDRLQLTEAQSEIEAEAASTVKVDNEETVVCAQVEDRPEAAVETIHVNLGELLAEEEAEEEPATSNEAVESDQVSAVEADVLTEVVKEQEGLELMHVDEEPRNALGVDPTSSTAAALAIEEATPESRPETETELSSELEPSLAEVVEPLSLSGESPESATLSQNVIEEELALPNEVEENVETKVETEEQHQHPLPFEDGGLSPVDEDVLKSEPESTPAEVEVSFGDGNGQLVPGCEVRVSLDHIIDDALVVSFRFGEKIFSGVLMDLSKRFGPYGIPVTVFPKREYRDKPESMHLKNEVFQTESKEITGATPEEPANNPPAPTNLWTSKHPPLFHEGAPYPPPLFIRDSYNQSIPQPPPRKIKRPKRKLYREEPTSIMNAIKLRPRQVLCDKCKNTIMTDKKDVKRGHTTDYRGEEGKRRRSESVAAVNKRLRTDHKVDERGRGSEGPKRHGAVVKVSGVSHSRGRVVRVGTATVSRTNSSRVQLNAKKVLQNKNVDHSKAREVLKMAKEKAQKRQRERGGGGTNAAVSKVHHTRRLQNSGSNAASLPPRIRIKPQRYRNEENDSSSCKVGFEKVQGSCKGVPKTATPRCTSTRSSAGEATSSENQSPTKGPELEAAVENKELVVLSEEREEKREKRGSKGNITVYMSLNQKKPDSSSASVCSSDSADDLKSSNSECSSTETFDFPPPGSLHTPSTSSSATAAAAATATSSSSSSKDGQKLSNSLQAKVFSKNVSKCVTPDGRTICVGDIVWAKIYGFPWWPARILAITVSRKDNGLLVRQEARISWFGSPTTSFLGLSQLSPFLDNFQLRFNKKRKGLYRKAITEAAKAAKQLTPEVRALLTQFET
ncbi:PWWP domain-containing protein 2A [Erpetoichthys calabaricus]|uniref:PWWP domain-containing protein 2A n=1 Tax=Erpetoichthys calabaricus TaxID=27687 RepID=UPI002234DD45|nr:PWWP domain-containing protein 2A [Erpetoichthys calabaricus]